MTLNISSFRAVVVNISIFTTLSLFISCDKALPPEPYGPLPTEGQLAWHEMEYFSLICYGLNTYTEQEWGYGDIDPKIFNPDNLDTDQWARVAKSAGMRGLILVAKHHDGFCLWPSRYTDYSVASTPWRDGEGDVLGDLRASCDKYNLKLGVYLSPWDRNHPEYGREEYITYFNSQLEELMTQYGDIFEFWIDGANGGDGYYGGANESRRIDKDIYYNYQSIFETCEKYHPDITIFSDVGPGSRWVGNEAGIGGETNWNLLNVEGRYPGTSDPEFTKKLGVGDKFGTSWVPAEINTTLLWPKAWYYHTGKSPRTLKNLVDLYYTSIGRGGPLNLGLAIAPTGLIQDSDVDALLKFKRQMDREFNSDLAKSADVTASSSRGSNFNIGRTVDGVDSTYWATEDGVNIADIEFDFGSDVDLNRVVMQEYIRLGQRVDSFIVYADVEGIFDRVLSGTTIGYKRAVRFKTVKTSKVKVTLYSDAPSITLSNIELYCAPVVVSDPVAKYSSDGVLTIEVDGDCDIYYSVSKQSGFIKYVEPIEMVDGGEISFYAEHRLSGEKSDTSREQFSVSKSGFMVVGDSKSRSAIDEDASTIWESSTNKLSIVVDLGEEQSVSGFYYLPRQDGSKEGTIYGYSLYQSLDGVEYSPVIESGIFSNIENNPVRQDVDFSKEIRCRYLKLVGDSRVKGSRSISVAEFGIFR